MTTFNKRKSVIMLVVLATTAISLGLFGITPQNAFAAQKEVEYTFTIADLGQGVWGGGSLFDDGTASGNVAFSAGNGQFIFQLHPVSWEELGDAEAVDICFETKQIKGDPFFPPEFCLSDFGLELPVTGEPVIEDGFLFRVTPAGN